MAKTLQSCGGLLNMKKKDNKIRCPHCKSTDIYYMSGDLGEEVYCRKCHKTSKLK
jgi:predicted RNA-binding Zn-ribbon protein involved in translation (DUF1610 family)